LDEVERGGEGFEGWFRVQDDKVTHFGVGFQKLHYAAGRIMNGRNRTEEGGATKGGGGMQSSHHSTDENTRRRGVTHSTVTP
jgi:hypothetical protein